MEFQKLQAPSLKELFVREIENRILSGELEIGSQLPTERELAEQLGVSRTVVNAGIAVMAGKGFLEIKPRIGVFVADYRRQGTVETLVSIMNYNGGTLCRAEIRSILEFKIMIDTLSLRRLVPNLTDEDTDVLFSHLERLRSGTRPAETAEAAFGFYHELCVRSGNTFSPLFYHSFKLPITNLWQRYTRLYGPSSIYEHTERLFNLMVARDLPVALLWVEEFISQSIEGIREIYME